MCTKYGGGKESESGLSRLENLKGQQKEQRTMKQARNGGSNHGSLEVEGEIDRDRRRRFD
jgi:hypothetical protein